MAKKKTSKQKQSFIDNELAYMGLGKIPEELKDE